MSRERLGMVEVLNRQLVLAQFKVSLGPFVVDFCFEKSPILDAFEVSRCDFH